MGKFHSSRRQFLKGAGVAIALPMLESLPSVQAAQKAKQPVKRFVCLSNNYGVYQKAFFADSTALFKSAVLAKFTLELTSPVAGLNTFAVLLDEPFTVLPLIKCSIEFILLLMIN